MQAQSIKRGQKILYKGKEYEILYPSLNFVKIKDEKGNEYKLSYDKITLKIDEPQST